MWDSNGLVYIVSARVLIMDLDTNFYISLDFVV